MKKSNHVKLVEFLLKLQKRKPRGKQAPKGAVWIGKEIVYL